MKNTEAAFRWIITLLHQHGIPFQISGGLAARAYGATRPLNDIDIDVPEDRFAELVPDVKKYITFGPARQVDERWDVFALVLEYERQEIDISGANTIRVCDARTQKWISLPADFSTAEVREIFGMKVPVMNRRELISYKQMLEGRHQQEDIDAALKFSKK